ncbi:hypothetical protein Acy02nite_71160 [Actinoplanes cyaneus]|uniref:ParB-like N-terminal domain-containing protein n=1 Tax=Actinoplanes cyaneus TaxID=52696 RepID=A0A919IW94_9ACTN|nr:ParB N-terminal domain-containing protein [Actinoplanes cyaneus]MCW2142218.1 Chromosome segregation protein Spo0J, contains ParB-like nuclease domain [Actinoplanes cyaneus]GID69235.1 hypothetical protein Acy02nite_71160 [Actinoplanes cyaneus]
MAPEEEEINRQPVVQVRVDSLKLGDSPRLAGENAEHVEAISAADGVLPPIVVHRSSMRVIDGAHRVRAARRRGEESIAARFFDGSEDDAFVLSVWLNIAHGLPLALADRKRAAARIVTSHPQWSDRRVASVTGISPATVADIRKRTGGAEPATVRIGQDGRVRPLDGSAGRRLAGWLMQQNPQMSLRQVARAAEISPETARDVRNRLHSGEDLVPAGRTRGRSDGTTRTGTTRTGTTRAGTTQAGGETGKPMRSMSIVVADPRSAGSRSAEPRSDRAAIVNRLMTDPALRYTETGRNLLRLLSLHTHWTEDWETIVNSVPPHCRGVMADLARQFAVLWSDLATRAEQNPAATG